MPGDAQPSGNGELRFRTLIEQLPAIIYTAALDEHSSTLYVSPQIEVILGFTPEEWMGDPQLWLKQVHPEDCAKVLAAVVQAQASDIPVPLEYRALTRDGRVVWLHDTANLVRDDAGTPLCLQGISVDITERKQAEAARRAIEERYRSLIEATPSAILVADMDTRISMVTPQAVRLFGFDTADEMLGRSVFELIVPEDHEKATHKIQRAITYGSSAAEYTLLRKDGPRFLAELHAAIITDEAGKPLALTGVLRDITEQRQAEVVLREREAHYRSLVEVSPDAIVQVDLCATILTTNQQTATLLGYTSADQLIGRSAFDFIAPEDQSSARAALEQTVTRGLVRDVQYTVIRNDGSRRAVEFNARLVVDAEGTPQTVIAVVRDITERKQAEQALRDSEERFRLLVEGAKDYAIFMLDPDGRVVSWNARAEHIKGYAAEEILGQHFSRFYPHEEIARGEPQQELRVAAAEGRFEKEGWRIRKDGSCFWANVVISALYDEVGLLRGFVRVTRDITDRKRSEQEHERLFAQVEWERERAEARIAELDAAFSAMTNGIVLYAPDGTIVRMNEAAEHVLGFTAVSKHLPLAQWHALLGLTWDNGQSVVNFDDLPAQRALRGEAVQDVVLGLPSAQTGHVFWLSINAAPIRDADGRLLGAVLTFSDITERKPAEAERARLFDQLQRLSRELLRAQEDERRRVARELHDESGQALTALKIRLEMLKAGLPGEDTTLRHQLAMAVSMVDETMERMRSLALELRPPALDAVGLNAALKAYCQSFAEHTRLVVDYAAVELPPVPDLIGICLYRFLQEALTNIAKHARARRAWIVLQRDAEEISLSVEDDGEGLDPSTLRSSSNRLMHMGLLGMRERLQLLGGRLDVDLEPGRGVHLVAHIPWRDSK
jgi:PAS domain S-box-containing protein